MKCRGLFVVFEGVNGAGKSAQLREMAQRLRYDGRRVVTTREPSDGPIGQLIRAALEHRTEVAPGSHGLLFAADRMDHVEREILPALEADAVLLCDRFIPSNVVFRAAETPGPLHADALGKAFAPAVLDRARRARELSAGAPVPDLTIVLDVSPEIAAERRRARGGAARLYDIDELQRRCCALYARAAELLPGERVVVVDGSGTIPEVSELVWAAIVPLLEEVAA